MRYEDEGLGLSFELRPGEASGDASEMALDDHEVSYVPISLGKAKVGGRSSSPLLSYLGVQSIVFPMQGYLPDYLEEEITFAASMITGLLCKLLPGLLAARKARSA